MSCISKNVKMLNATPAAQVSSDVGGGETVGRVSALDDALQRRVEGARSRGKVLRWDWLNDAVFCTFFQSHDLCLPPRTFFNTIVCVSPRSIFFYFVSTTQCLFQSHCLCFTTQYLFQSHHFCLATQYLFYSIICSSPPSTRFISHFCVYDPVPFHSQ